MNILVEMVYENMNNSKRVTNWVDCQLMHLHHMCTLHVKCARIANALQFIRGIVFSVYSTDNVFFFLSPYPFSPIVAERRIWFYFLAFIFSPSSFWTHTYYVYNAMCNFIQAYIVWKKKSKSMCTMCTGHSDRWPVYIVCWTAHCILLSMACKSVADSVNHKTRLIPLKW